MNNSEQQQFLQQQQPQPQHGTKQVVKISLHPIGHHQQDNQHASKSISSIHQTYSNLIPQMITNLMDKTSSNEDNNNYSDEGGNDNEAELGDLNKNLSEDTSNALQDMSLLNSDMSLLNADMSINNADSLFGNTLKMSENDTNNKLDNHPSESTAAFLMNMSEKSLQQHFGTEPREVVSSFDGVLNSETTSSNCSSKSETNKIIKNFANLLNDSSLNSERHYFFC